jgi:hypothetical protein
MLRRRIFHRFTASSFFKLNFLPISVMNYFIGDRRPLYILARKHFHFYVSFCVCRHIDERAPKDGLRL